MTQQSPIQWIRSHYKFPYCQRVSSHSDLKTGIAIAEILTDILPQKYHNLFMPKITINPISIQKSIGNLKTIINVLELFLLDHSYLKISMKGFASEGLYYRESMMLKFVTDILMVLEGVQINEDGGDGSKGEYLETYQSTIANHIVQSNISELSQIHNCSSVVLEQYQKPAIKVKAQEANIENTLPDPTNGLTESKMSQLYCWLSGKLKITDLSEPDLVFGQIINAVFSNDRSSKQIIKEAHFQQGSIYVYRKGLSFILESAMAERVNKENVAIMMKTMSEENIVRETEFWMVVNDIYQYDIKKRVSGRGVVSGREVVNGSGRGVVNGGGEGGVEVEVGGTGEEVGAIGRAKTKTKTNPKTKTEGREKQREGVHDLNDLKNRNIEKENIKLNKKQKDKQILSTQKWISQQLGYKHSLQKSKLKETSIFQNPLKNGTLIGSILMRLKIGKPILIKHPQTFEHIKSNWEQNSKICRLRGLQSWPINFTKQDAYQKCLENLNKVKIEYQRINTKIVKNPSEQKCNGCEYQSNKYYKEKRVVDKQDLIKWIQNQLKIVGIQKKLSIEKMIEICGEVVNVNIYRSTTKKIEESNVEKILNELRRIGLSAYYQISCKQVVDQHDDSLRWKIVDDLKWLIDGKIQRHPS